MSGSLDWNRISKDSQASTNPLEIHPSQECSLWNSLHFYVDLKDSTQKSQEIFAKYFVLLPFWFCENLLGFTWKDNRITLKAYKFSWKASLKFKGLVEVCESLEMPRSWFQSSDPLIYKKNRSIFYLKKI